MAAPKYKITQNTPDSSTGSEQRSSGWITCFVRYTEPDAAVGTSNNTVVSIIRNDVVGVSIENNKSQFGKMCRLTMKSTDIFYPTRVSPGDWCFVWMHDNPVDTQLIFDELGRIQNNNQFGRIPLTGEKSGLKFAGRVIGVSHTDSAAPGGARTINQTVSAQAFLEFATSVYYTRDPRSLFDINSKQSTNGVDVSAIKTIGEQAIIEGAQGAALNQVTRELYEQLKKVITNKQEASPDKVMCLFYILMMGVKNQDYVKGLQVTANTAIEIPRAVGLIFGIKDPKYLPDIIDLYAGLQKYKTGGAWYENFTPILAPGQISKTIRFTGIPTKGFVPLRFRLWDNTALWDIMNMYLNPVCNEIYTCLRMGPQGRIKPTVVMREKPFSTGLFDRFGPDGKLEKIKQAVVPPKELGNQSSKEGNAFIDNTGSILPSLGAALSATPTQSPSPAEKLEVSITSAANANERTFFGNLPRWVIDESMVRSFSYRTNEASRINFVQVWGVSAQAQFADIRIDHNTMQSMQLAAGNYFFNQNDIARNGLRAYIINSEYDVLINSPTAPTLSRMWAQMNADWLFNGHLKINGTITCNGIQAPICEGDNLEYRSMLFHIEAVNHAGSLSPDGKKTWTTTLTLTHGVMAYSVQSNSGVPVYQQKWITDRKDLAHPRAPGITEFQDFNEKGPKNLENASNKLNDLKGKLV